MAVAEVIAHFRPFPGAEWTISVVSATVAAIAVSGPLRMSDLGLSRATVATGLRYAAVIIGGVAVIVVAGVALPITRDLFRNDNYAHPGTALFSALVIIPLLTVLPEELFFRGVMLGGLERLYPGRTGLIAQSLLFGVWHVISSLHLTAENAGLTSVLGHGPTAQAAGMIGAVALTTVAGFLLGWLRVRSGSLLAPIALHWAANGLGAIGAAIAWQLSG